MTENERRRGNKVLLFIQKCSHYFASTDFYTEHLHRKLPIYFVFKSLLVHYVTDLAWTVVVS